jgi:hypothetical protein
LNSTCCAATTSGDGPVRTDDFASVISDANPLYREAIELGWAESGAILKELATLRAQLNGMAAAGTDWLNQGRT